MTATLTTTATAPVLRDYQAAAVAHVRAALAEGTRSVYVELPTGSGKSVVLAELARQVLAEGGRVLALAHLKELVWQLAGALERGTGESAGVVMAAKDDTSARLIVASVQTLTRPRLARVLAQGTPTLVLVDEAHHATPVNRYGRLLDALNEANPEVHIVGVTATPFRGDKWTMADTFARCAFARSITQMQAAGVLCALRWHPITLPSLDLATVPTQTVDGLPDWPDAPLSEQLTTPVALAETVAQTVPLIGARPALAFCADVRHAQALASKYRTQGTTAAAVWGTMPQRDRADVLAAWRSGAVQVVANVGVLVEGFDFPALSALIMARPTRNPGRYLQALGRGTRTHPDKVDTLVLDLGGGAGLVDVSPITLPTILAVEPESVALKPSPFYEPIDAEEQSYGVHVDPIGRASRAWVAVDGMFALALDSATRSAIVLAPHGEAGVWTVAQVSPNRVLTKHPLPLRQAVAAAELAMTRSGLVSRLTERTAPWRSRDASAKQMRFLRSLDQTAAQRAEYLSWSAGQVSDAIDVVLLRRLIRRNS